MNISREDFLRVLDLIFQPGDLVYRDDGMVHRELNHRREITLWTVKELHIDRLGHLPPALVCVPGWATDPIDSESHDCHDEDLVRWFTVKDLEDGDIYRIYPTANGDQFEQIMPPDLASHTVQVDVRFDPVHGQKVVNLNYTIVDEFGGCNHFNHDSLGTTKTSRFFKDYGMDTTYYALDNYRAFLCVAGLTDDDTPPH